MKRFICVSIITILVSLSSFLTTTCYAVRSNIYKKVLSYSNDYYETFFTTNTVESELVHYYGDKIIDTYIMKRVTSDWYVDYIENVIREYYPPPLYDMSVIISAIRKAKEDDCLWIMEEVFFDYRNRSVAIHSEKIYNSDYCIVDLKPEATFHFDYDYADMDNSDEYGKIATDMVDFLESIKDIYFDDKKRAEHELKGLSSRNFDYYGTYLHNKWERVPLIDNKGKNYSNVLDVYVDAQSIHYSEKYLEGWIKIILNEEKFTSLANGKKVKEFGNSFPSVSTYYVRFDFKGKQFLIIAGYEKFKDNSEKKYVLNQPEIWTQKNYPLLVPSVLNQVANIYNNKRDYWGSRGSR